MMMMSGMSRSSRRQCSGSGCGRVGTRGRVAGGVGGHIVTHEGVRVGTHDHEWVRVVVHHLIMIIMIGIRRRSRRSFVGLHCDCGVVDDCGGGGDRSSSRRSESTRAADAVDEADANTQANAANAAADVAAA